ncbi:MAG: hypothetical protein JRI68_00210 [Deltaproteobacteria bacterium]|nr:hypothetical protein [Deltaproteobacteria bacterium]
MRRQHTIPFRRAIGPLCLALALATGCDSEKVACKAPSSAGETVTWTECADGVAREVRCKAPGGHSDKMYYACTCIKGGAVGKHFELDKIATLRRLAPPSPADDIEAAYRVINEQCEWAIGPK